MYKHILLPTDGSRISEEAAAAGIDLARALGARVTAMHVIADAQAPGLEKWAHHDREFEANLQEVLERRGVLYLETIRDAARSAGVACDCRLARRRGGDGTLLGSETVKAATLGTVPVLVHRELRSLKGRSR